MAQNIYELTMDSNERIFLDMMQHGDDFFKIELLRQAKHCYQKALETNIEPELVKEKIAKCEQLLAYENKVILILSIIAVVGLAVYLLVTNLG